MRVSGGRIVEAMGYVKRGLARYRTHYNTPTPEFGEAEQFLCWSLHRSKTSQDLRAMQAAD